MEYVWSMYGVSHTKKMVQYDQKTKYFLRFIFNSFFVFKDFYELSVEGMNTKETSHSRPI